MQHSIELARHNSDKLTVVRHNNLNQASYALPLDARRLIISAISKVNSAESIPDEIQIYSDEFAEQWNLKKNNSYTQLKNARKKLFDQVVKVNKIDSGEVWEVRWVDAAAYQDGKGYIVLSFSNRIKPYLSDLKSHFTSYRLNEIRHFRSTHAIRIYELLMQYKKTGWYLVTVADLKHMLNVSDKYKRWAEFKRNVLDVSIKEINTQSNFEISVEFKRKGRFIHEIYFKIDHKQQPDLFLVD